MEENVKKQYDEYLETHIRNVTLAYEWLMKNAPHILKENPDAEPIQIRDQLKDHDKSKYSEEEYEPYAIYFYGKHSEEVDKKFDYAWLHHIHNNPHHWQHYILIQDDDPDKVLEMEFRYIIEMICDWWTFSWKNYEKSHDKKDLYSIFDWYQSRTKLRLGKETKKTVEHILEELRDAIDEFKE